MSSDIEIAQQAEMKKIADIANLLGIPEDKFELYGKFKAKIDFEALDKNSKKSKGKIVLVTAISPTPAGEGKTTTTVGLGDALNKIGKKTVICLREPCMGPVFGAKGGATGGGMSQVVPMEDINLHFTGDFSAIAFAHNLLCSMIDNHIHHGNDMKIDPARITFKRVMELNDRVLRKVVVGLGGKVNGQTREEGFDIVVASEVMAILCLAESLKDLKKRLGNIVVGYSYENIPITAKDLKAHGAMTVLLKNALKPNLVQTLEHTPSFIHGGPFANIAHGCNSVIATRLALGLADYVVTEAGFGADLGAEKFIDIKCRKSGLRPSVCVLVATVRALKYHGGLAVKDCSSVDTERLTQGLANLDRHIQNITKHFNLPCVIAINRFGTDDEIEIKLVQNHVEALGLKAIVANHWSEGGTGAIELANAVVQLGENKKPKLRMAYKDSDSLWEKMRKIAVRIYGAKGISASRIIRSEIEKLQSSGFGNFPICVAKTQYSFSTDASLRGAPKNHMVTIREVRLCAGAEFIVMICDDILTMPGLPKNPSACTIDIGDDGHTVGLS